MEPPSKLNNHQNEGRLRHGHRVSEDKDRATINAINTEPPKELTQEDKRIKIAQTLGWTDCRLIVWEGTKGLPYGDDPSSIETPQFQKIPEYFTSLDACAEFAALGVENVETLRSRAEYHVDGQRRIEIGGCETNGGMKKEWVRKNGERVIA